MDVRHPLTEHDQDMLALAPIRGLPVHMLLTKADKLGRGAAGCAAGRAPPVRRAGMVTAQLFSAHSGRGFRPHAARSSGRSTGSQEKETPVGPADPTGAS